MAEGVGAAEIPTDVWTRLIERHDGWTLGSIGHSARLRGRLDVACSAFGKLAHDEDPHAAAHGVDDLGAALNVTGDEAGAIERLQSVVDSEFDCVRASASYRLAGALGRAAIAEREALYRTVLEHPNSWAYPKAAVNLGLLLRAKTSVESVQTKRATLFLRDSDRTDHDRPLEDEAQKLFEQAINSNDREAIGNGANALGVLLCSRGEIEAGERALKKGMDAGSLQATVSFALTVYDIPGRETEAWQLIDRAERMEHDEREKDYLNLAAGVIANARGDVDEAIARCRSVIANDREEYRDDAALRLARLLVDNERGSNEAITLLRGIIASGARQSDDAQKLLDDIRSSGYSDAGS